MTYSIPARSMSALANGISLSVVRPSCNCRSELSAWESVPSGLLCRLTCGAGFLRVAVRDRSSPWLMAPLMPRRSAARPVLSAAPWPPVLVEWFIPGGVRASKPALKSVTALLRLPFFQRHADSRPRNLSRVLMNRDRIYAPNQAGVRGPRRRACRLGRRRKSWWRAAGTGDGGARRGRGRRLIRDAEARPAGARASPFR